MPRPARSAALVLSNVAALALVASASLAGCSAPLPPPLAETAAAAVVADDLDPSSLAIAAERSAAMLAGVDRWYPVGGRRITSAELRRSALHVAEIARSAHDSGRLAGSLARDCVAWRSGAAAHVTGYYEPVLPARRVRDGPFVHPVYRMPDAATLAAVRRRLGHAPSREDIDRDGVLAGLGLEIAWLDDPVALFFLHVQGSGALVLEDGRTEHVGFAGTNGLVYRSIGRVMVERRFVERANATAATIRAWLDRHPARRDEILFANPRYVFFEPLAGDGPVGSSGAALVAGRSIAVDPHDVPPGMLAWLRTSSSNVTAGAPLVSRFVFSQDSGAAIRGAGRVDLFEGSGDAAGAAAGARDQNGDLLVLLCAPQAGR